MKHILIYTFLCCLVRFGIAAQNYPQYDFYSHPGPYEYFGIEHADDSSNFLNLTAVSLILQMSDEINTPQYVDIEYELYKIESRILVSYTTADNVPHPYFDSLHESGKVGYHVYDDETKMMTAYFRNPLDQLDASVFSENLSSLKLPVKADIAYGSSPRMNVANLKKIEGKDVHYANDISFLVDKNGVLVAGAVCGISEVFVPAHAEALGDACFRGATELNSVHCRADVARIGERSLDVPSPVSLYLERETPVEIHALAFGDNAPHKIFVPDKKLAKTYSKLYPQWKKLFKVDKTLAK